MDDAGLYSADIGQIQEEIARASGGIDRSRCALLRHYLLNYILYENTPVEEREDSPILERLTAISILLERLKAMEKKVEVLSHRRTVDRQMMRNRNDALKKPTAAPMERRRRGAERLMERTRQRADPNINVKRRRARRLE